MKAVKTLLFTAIVMVLVCGCQRNKFPTGAAEQDPNAPKYSVAPAIGGGTVPVEKVEVGK